MSLIDLKKLNAELDQLIANQDAEIKAMKERRMEKLEKAFMWMITDLTELKLVFMELDIGRISVETQITWKEVGENYKIGFPKDSPSSVLLETDCCLAGRIWLEGHWSTYEHFEAKVSGDTESFVLQWCDQYPEFKKRFENECIKRIKEKAEKANARYEAARKECERVCG